MPFEAVSAKSGTRKPELAPPSERIARRQHALAKQLEVGAVELDALFGVVIGHAPRSDAPARLLVAAFLGHHRACRVSGTIKLDVAGLVAAAFERRQPPAFPERQQQVGHRPRLELVGQLEAVGEQLVSVFVDEADVARGDDLPGGAVPADLIGTDRLLLRTQYHVALGGDRVGIAVVAYPVGFERDLARTGGILARDLAVEGGNTLVGATDVVRIVGALNARRLAFLRGGRSCEHGQQRDG